MGKPNLKKVRCAIYTRKSTEEGLDQVFNTLHAQREACEAYIQSQTHEGWVALPTLYDDGGFSGGSMERPALKQLLEDIRAGDVDTVVVYKIDRLTRALVDFAKMVEVFDDPAGNGSIKAVSFVSVTQQFNTTTSMGRLTLNVLLSFAQFEREVIGERVRDKVAASKKKGMWMGGVVPLGYDTEEKMLVVNKTEAKTVRHIFESYERTKSVNELRRRLDKEGVVSKARTSKAGKYSGGKPIARGALYSILRNRLYLGEVQHVEKVFPGQHEAILERDLWDRVQAILNANKTRNSTGSDCKNPSLLAGLIYDGDGHRLTPSHAVKSSSSGAKKRYRYYVSRALTTGTSTGKGLRIPADDIEMVIIHRLGLFLTNPSAVHGEIGRFVNGAHGLNQLSQNATNVADTLKNEASKERKALLDKIISKIAIQATNVKIEVSRIGLVKALGGNIDPTTENETFSLTEKALLKRCGMEMKLILGEDNTARKPDPTLVKLVSRSSALLDQLTLSDKLSISDLAEQENVTPSYISRLLRLATLSPKVTEKILTGQQPPELTAAKLMHLPKLPVSWKEQEKSLRF